MRQLKPNVYAVGAIDWDRRLFDELIPLPDFAEYQVPETETETTGPAASSERLQYVHLAALLAGLSLATLFALAWRSRRGLFLLAVASLAWLGFWREGCVCPIGAIQNVVLALSDPSYAVPIVVVLFFALPLIRSSYTTDHCTTAGTDESSSSGTFLAANKRTCAGTEQASANGPFAGTPGFFLFRRGRL